MDAKEYVKNLTTAEKDRILEVLFFFLLSQRNHRSIEIHDTATDYTLRLNGPWDALGDTYRRIMGPQSKTFTVAVDALGKDMPSEAELTSLLGKLNVQKVKVTS